MNNKPASPAIAIVTLASVVILVAGMKAAASIVVPFILSLFIAVIFAPPLFWMKKKGIPTGAAISLLVIAVVLIWVGFAAIIGASANSFTKELPFYKQRLNENLEGVMTALTHYGVVVPKDSLLESFDPGYAMELVANLIKELGGVLANTFLILLAVIFMLLEASSFPAKLAKAMGRKNLSLPEVAEFTESLKTYVVMKTLISFFTGILAALLVWTMGVDYPLLWGLIAFLLNYIPTLGSIIAAVPAVILAFVQYGAQSSLIIAVGFVAINVIMGNVVEPRVMGRGLGLSTLVVFFSLVFWGWVLGPVGMILSVPLTITLKIALESNAETRWIAIFLGSER